MNLFSITSLTCGISCLVLSIITAIYGRFKIHRILVAFNISVALWGIGLFFAGIADNSSQSLIGWKIAHYGGFFIGPLFYYLVCTFCKVNRKSIIIFAFIQAVFFNFLNIFTNSLFNKTRYVYHLYYNEATLLLTIGVFFYLILVVLSYKELFKIGISSRGYQKLQSYYMIFGFMFGFIGGTSTFLPEFKIDFIYPIGNFGITLYCLIVTYAILRYKLLELSIVATRTTIFVAVYSIVLGIPFAIAFGFEKYLINLIGEQWWMIPLSSSTLLATIGPFIYLYIQRRAEDTLFQEQRRYQATLRQASVGMGRIKDLNRLLMLIVHIVTRTVRLEHTMIFLDNSLKKKYILGAYRSRVVRFKPQEEIDYESPLVKELIQTRGPLVFEEINQQSQELIDLKYTRLVAQMKQLNVSLVVPSFVDEKLLAIIVLGNKVSKKLYTHDDLTIFTILANQAALAIENAMFYEDMKRTHEQLFKAEKMATIGTMADGLSHQINNRLHALGFIAGDVLDTIKLKKKVPMSDEVREMMVDIEHALTRVQENVFQGGEIVRGLLKYTRKSEEGFTQVDLDALLDAAIEMTQFKIKKGSLHIIREFDRSIPKINGNFTQLQEVFFNLIDNAYDAMAQRKDELKEPGYQPTIKISVNHNGTGSIDIFVKDNGIGIRDEDKIKLFTPFFTTKLSSKKGTGLGLYVIQKLIEQNHEGKVSYESHYKEGTTVHLTLKTA